MKTTMKRFANLLFCCCLLLLVQPTISFSQEEGPVADGDGPGRAGAFQFHLVGGFGISFAAPVLSQSAFRFTIDLDLNNRDLGGASTNRNVDNFSSSFQSSSVSSDRNSYMLDAVISYIYATPVSGETYFFFGFGPVGRYAGFSEKSTSRVTASSSSNFQYIEYEYNTKERGAGVRATLGFEAFVTPRLSVLAEYQVSGLHIWTKNESKSRYEYTTNFDEYSNSSDQKGWQFDLDSVRLSIAVYL